MPSAPARNWTKEQLQAIRSIGRSVLISAAAGSGKTSVLSERCAYLVCDAPSPCDVNRLLVVTFTEAAAGEMKSRIAQTLRNRLEANPDDLRLRRQMALIDQAAIGTLHGFCGRVVRQNFHLLGLDPNFRILDGDEAMLLRLEAARDLFAQRYDAADADFLHFVDCYGEGRDDALMRQVIATHELMNSLVDPQEWQREAIGKIEQAARLTLEESELGRQIIGIVEQQLEEARTGCRSAIEALARLGGFEKYVGYLDELAGSLDDCTQLLREQGYTALAEQMKRFKLERLPSTPNTLAHKEIAKSLVDDARAPLGNKGELAQLLLFSSADWRKGLELIRSHARLFLSLVEQFGRLYAEEKRAGRLLDFADLERNALRLLTEGDVAKRRPSTLARQLHQRYEHVLVDEYQDINEVQDAILQLVSRECLADDARGNLFCVGDIKQSIYGFRLAEPTLFLERHERFRTDPRAGAIIDLQANFRSRKPLLDALNDIFERLMNRASGEFDYDDSQRLHAMAEFAPADGATCFAGAPIELHYLPDQVALAGGDDESDGAGDSSASELKDLERSQREALFIARRIRQIMGIDGGQRMQVSQRSPDGTLTTRPIDYRDIVILLRATRYHADEYADVLRWHAIPVHNASGGGFFDCTEVRDVLSLLRLLDNQCQDVPLAAFLRSPMSGLLRPEEAMACVRIAYPQRRLGQDQSNAVDSFHQAVHRYAAEQNDELAGQLRAIFRALDELRLSARHRPIHELVWSIYERFSLLTWCAGLDDGPQRRANLLELYERARQFGSFSKQGLYRFIRFLENLSENFEVAQASELSESADVVRIMSIHKSKGLEFPLVFLPSLGKRINFSGCNGSLIADRRQHLGLMAVDEQRFVRYPSLPWWLVSKRLRKQAIAEELRVLYVAATRAKEHLILVGTCSETAPDKWRQRWEHHGGALPADVVTGANTMLDWLGPVAAATAGKGTCIETHAHSADQVAAWVQQSSSPGFVRSRVNEKLAGLTPLPNPVHDPAADQIIGRLNWRYPRRAFADLSASRSVTSWAKHAQRAAPGSDEPATETPDRIWLAPEPMATVELPRPRCMNEDPQLSATDRGTAVHLFLEHLDFSRPCNDADLRAQLNSLLERRLISPAQAASVDFATIRWFLDSDLGRLCRERAAQLVPELPLNCAVAPDRFIAAQSDEPLDQVMIRGRIDLLVPVDGGFELIDYKTDRVDQHTVRLRAEEYRPQVEFYSEAIWKITGKPVLRSHLVFLTPRLIETFESR